MKDNFSNQANFYAQFRPEYPAELYEFVLLHTQNRDCVWDCATGNGQAAKILSQCFRYVCASDISQKQLNHAFEADNILYTRQAAEKTDFPDQCFDLITVAQAAHWFRLDDFYAEVERVAKPTATLAIWGYGTLFFPENPILNDIFQNFYWKTMGAYWDAERKYVDMHYKTLSFPFKNVLERDFNMRFEWSVATMEGYVNSWSAVQHFIKARQYNPVFALMQALEAHWGETQRVVFPIFLKIGYMNPLKQSYTFSC